MTLYEYQQAARRTANFPIVTDQGYSLSWVYPLLGLAGEAGEVVEKLKKVWRNDGGYISEQTRLSICDELGDLMWYLANIASELDVSLDLIGQRNIDKLADRITRKVIFGEGDNR